MSENKSFIDGSDGQLTASIVTYYSVPDNTSAKITAFTLCNTTATPRTVDVHLVASGESADASNQVVDSLAIGANSSEILAEAIGQVLETGGTIQMLADAATAISVIASGREY